MFSTIYWFHYGLAAVLLSTATPTLAARRRLVTVCSHLDQESALARCACADHLSSRTHEKRLNPLADLSHLLNVFDVDEDEVLYSVMPAGLDSSLLSTNWSFSSDVARVVQSANLQRLMIQEGVHTTAQAVRLVYMGTGSAVLARAPVRQSLERLDEAFHAEVARVVSSVKSSSIQADLTWLTGEAQESPIWTRHSFSDGALVAADWLLQTFEREGGASCHLWHYGQGWAPNVVCDFSPAHGTAEDAPMYILGAHYDSRGSFGQTRAPGGDDDASGVSQMLAIARGLHANGVKLQSRFRIVAFAGEEQGLVGSAAYAAKLRKESTPVALMIQADMLGYHVPGEPAQLGLPAVYHTPIASHLVGMSLLVGITRACCSDTQSFLENGFIATEMFERAGPIADPMYHSSGDLINRIGYDVEQIRSIAKVTFATILHAAGFIVE
ncbi:hypothetical protein BKA62DRAFT_715545 [Auriculariales sp. MPI-PUGE-AT-0066]|nr:hypothetical protein BKA62DRAFT_715545 [Auriculariales sp. MPI-PUGE-AT-0066]